MPEAREVFLERRKSELFVQLKGVHDTLTDMQDQHNATPYKCIRNGACCQVGLQLHVMECEYIAKNLLEMARGDLSQLEGVIDRLELALTDTAWSWDESVGDHMCAFFEDGCSIYPFRPSVCRMYGVTLEVDEWCPRKRGANGIPFVFAQKETDRFAAHFYKTLDTYGRLWPTRDYTMYMPAGVLGFLLSKERLRELRARTPAKFWKRQRGYRTQYTPSYRKTEARRSNVRFAFPIPGVTAPQAKPATKAAPKPAR